jgi:two-component system LytT family sensor kinase
MRKLIFLLFMLNSALLFAQNRPALDTTRYYRVPRSGYFVEKSDTSKYMVFDGKTVVDIRKAKPNQLARIATRTRMQQLEEDGFRGLMVDGGNRPFPRHSLAWRFLEKTEPPVYTGIPWKWGTLVKNTLLIDGEASVEVIDTWITSKNAKDYKYRIIQNDNTELVGWTTPTVFKKTADQSQSYCFLATLPYHKGRFIQVEIYNIKNYKDRDAVIIDWRETRALQMWTGLDYYKKNRSKTILSVSLGGDLPTTPHDRFEKDASTQATFRLADSLIRLNFISQHSPTPYNYQIRLRRTINGVTEELDLGEFNERFYLYREFWDKPGRYAIMFTPKLVKNGGQSVHQTAKATTFTFTTLPALNQGTVFSTTQLIMIGLGAITLFGSILAASIIYVKKKNQRVVRRSQQQKEMVKTQLNGIRAQLNPHFMFNALAGIQNLMNKNKTDEANEYLRKFARLTRSVLDQQDLIGIRNEASLLDDYLHMEQLRFGFTYTIHIAEDLANENIEIPSMLLQPFVENAVKHGIAEKGQQGRIAINFIKQNTDLLLKITDNGKGFDTEKDYTGLGLQLSKSRIALLNTIYASATFALTMRSDQHQTEIIITLAQWL